MMVTKKLENAQGNYRIIETIEGASTHRRPLNINDLIDVLISKGLISESDL